MNGKFLLSVLAGLLSVVLVFVLSDRAVHSTQQSATFNSAKVFNATAGITVPVGSSQQTKDVWNERSPHYPGDTWPASAQGGFITDVFASANRCLGSGECITYEVFIVGYNTMYIGRIELQSGRSHASLHFTSGAGFPGTPVTITFQVTGSGITATTNTFVALHGFDL